MSMLSRHGWAVAHLVPPVPKFRMHSLCRFASSASGFDGARSRAQYQTVVTELNRLDLRSPSFQQDAHAGFSALLRWAAQIPSDASHARQAAREAVRSAIQKSQAKTTLDSMHVDTMLVSYIRTFGHAAASEPLWVLSLALHLGHWPSPAVSDAAALCLLRSGHTDTALSLLLAYPDMGHVHSDACVTLLHEALQKKTAFAASGSSAPSSPPPSEMGQAIVDMLLASFRSVEGDSAAAAGVLKALVCSAAGGSEASATAAQALVGHLARSSVQGGSKRGVDVAVVLQSVLEYAVRMVVRHHASAHPPLNTPWDPLQSQRGDTASVQTRSSSVPPPPPEPYGDSDDPPPPPPAAAPPPPPPTPPPPPPAPAPPPPAAATPPSSLMPQWHIPDPDLETTVCKLAEGLVSAVLAASPPPPLGRGGSSRGAAAGTPLVTPPTLAALLGVFTVCNMPSRSRQLLPLLRMASKAPPFAPPPEERDAPESCPELHSALRAASLNETHSLATAASAVAGGMQGGASVRPWLLPLLTPRYASSAAQTMQYVRRAGVTLSPVERTALARAMGWQWQALRITAGGGGDSDSGAETAAAANAVRLKGVKGASKTAGDLLVGSNPDGHGLMCPACGVGKQGGGHGKRRGGASAQSTEASCACLRRAGSGAASEHSDDDEGGIPAGAAARAARRATSLWPSRGLGVLLGEGVQGGATEEILQPMLLAAAATPCSKEAEHVFQLISAEKPEHSQRARKAARAKQSLYALWRWWAHLHGGSPAVAKQAWGDVADLIAPSLAREAGRIDPQQREPHAGDLAFVSEQSASEQQRIGSSLMLGHAWMYLASSSSLHCPPSSMLRVGGASLGRSFLPATREGGGVAPLDRDVLSQALVRAFAAAACRCVGASIESASADAAPLRPGAGQVLAPPAGSPLAETLRHDLQRGLLALDKQSQR